MTDIDYRTLASGSGGVPPDGSYKAYLVSAKLSDYDGGAVITEWTAGDYYWDSWNRFGASNMRYTQELLDGLGVDRARMMQGDSQDERDDNLRAALSEVQGGEFLVRVESNPGSRGDRVFTNTYVSGPASTEALQRAQQQEAQQSMDVPMDTSGLPPASTPAAGVGASTSPPADDDIPFLREPDRFEFEAFHGHENR